MGLSNAVPPSASTTRTIAARPHRQSAVRERGEGGGQLERRHQAGAERQRRHVGQIVQPDVATPAAAPGATRCAAAVALAARLFDSSSAARSVSRPASHRCALRGAHSSGPCGAIESGPSSTDTGDIPVLERGGVEERLECRAGLAPAARRTVELRLPEVATADHRQHVAGRGSIATSAACSCGSPNRPQPALPPRVRPAPAASGNKRRSHFPVGRMIAAELGRGTAAAGIPSRSRAAGRSRRGYGRMRMPRACAARFLRRRDESFLAHPRQDDVAALDRAVEVRPRRQRRRRARQPGDERALGKRQLTAPACRTSRCDIVSTP